MFQASIPVESQTNMTNFLIVKYQDGQFGLKSTIKKTDLVIFEMLNVHVFLTDFGGLFMSADLGISNGRSGVTPLFLLPLCIIANWGGGCNLRVVPLYL